MGIFSGRHYPKDVILWAVRWYCRYGVSYRDLEEMLTERGVPVDHTTIYRWVQKYGPELDKRTRWYRQTSPWFSDSWRVDETYIRVGGRWCYLYRAVTADGRTLDFYMSTKRNTTAATRFLGKALRCAGHGPEPRMVDTGFGPSILVMVPRHRRDALVLFRSGASLAQLRSVAWWESAAVVLSAGLVTLMFTVPGVALTNHIYRDAYWPSGWWTDILWGPLSVVLAVMWVMVTAVTVGSSAKRDSSSLTPF